MQTTDKMGLVAWNQILDDYDYVQLTQNWNIIDFHDHTPGRGVQIPMGGIAPGAVGVNQLTSDVIGSRGAVTGGTTAISTTTYTVVDKQDNVVLPANGLIAVWYQATWQESTSNHARAAIFVGSNQAKVAQAAGPVTQAAGTGGSTPGDSLPLASFAGGLMSLNATSTNYSGDVTTGQIVGVNGTVAQEVNGSISTVASLSVGGPCWIFAPAGTYTVGVYGKVTNGGDTATFLNRTLWVKAFTYA